MLHKIGSMMERTSDQVLFNEFGIGYSQFKILFALSHHEGVQQKEIAQFLGQTEASISRQIKLLKEVGSITVTLGEDDKKKHHIGLTATGQTLLDNALRVLGVFYEPILSVTSTPEQVALAKTLSRVHDQLQSVCELTFGKS